MGEFGCYLDGVDFVDEEYVVGDYDCVGDSLDHDVMEVFVEDLVNGFEK